MKVLKNKDPRTKPCGTPFPSADIVVYVGSLISVRQVTFNIGNSILKKSIGI